MHASNAQIVHSHDPMHAAMTRAHADKLPLGTEITVTDMKGADHRYEVSRSALSRGMTRGGRVALRSLDEEQARVPEGVHVIHATSAQEAADLFAAEMGGHLVSHSVEVDTHTEFSNPQVFDVHRRGE